MARIENMTVKELADHLVVFPSVNLLVLEDLREIENIADYLDMLGIKCRYLHGEIEPRFRVEILRAFKEGKLEVLVTTPEFAKGIPPKPNYSLN